MSMIALRMIAEADQLASRKWMLESDNPFGEGPIGSTKSGKAVQPYDHEHYAPVHRGKTLQAKLKGLQKHHGDWSSDDHADAARHHDYMAGLAKEHHGIFTDMHGDGSELSPADKKQYTKLLSTLSTMEVKHRDIAGLHRHASGLRESLNQACNRIEENKCECEHAAHFSDSRSDRHHEYGIRSEDLIPVKTDYGTFKVCRDCAKNGHDSLFSMPRAQSDKSKGWNWGNRVW